MASIVYRKSGKSYEAKFVSSGHQRRVYLGKIAKKDASAILRHIENLETVQMYGGLLDGQTRNWLDNADDKLKSKLEKEGLISQDDRHRTVSVGELFDLFVDWKRQKSHGKGLNEATVESWARVAANVCSCFGADCEVSSLTGDDGDKLITWLRSHGHSRGKTLADSTLVKRAQKVRSVFKFAVKNHWVAENPIPAELRGFKSTDSTRIQFVSRNRVSLVLDGPGTHYNAGFTQSERDQVDCAIVLARYQAITMPSEGLALRWPDIDLDNRRMRIYKPKTDKWREMPIFAESLPYLKHAHSVRTNEHVISEARLRSHKNWWTILKRRVLSAGVDMWPKLWQNLRVSACIEIATDFPEFVENEWCGHTGPIAKEFYLHAAQEHFARAIKRPQREDVAWLTDGMEFSASAEAVG